MLGDIKEHIARCTICARAKHSNNKRVMEGHLVFPTEAGHTYAIDIVGSIPTAGQYKKILVIVCAFSRFTVATALRMGTTAEVIRALEETFTRIGYPAQIISDNAGNFTSDDFLNYLAGQGIEHKLTTPYTPTGNALAERSIRSVLSLLRVMCQDKPKDWYAHLGQVCTAINEGFNLTLKERPFFLFTMRDPQPRIKGTRKDGKEVTEDEKLHMKSYARELVERELQKDHEARDKKMQTSGRVRTYSVGDKVYLQRRFVSDKGHKLKHPYIGPYRVMDVSGNTVVLKSLTNGKSRRASMRHLKIYREDTLTRTQNPNVGRVFPMSSTEEEEFLDDIPEGEVENATNNPPRYNLRNRKK